jgi:hypothetical protein
MTQHQTESVVDEFLRERREEVEAERVYDEAARRLAPVETGEQFTARLEAQTARVLARQAAKRREKAQAA